MATKNELNNEQLTKVNMIELVGTNFNKPENVLIYNTNTTVKNKIIAFNGKYSILEAAILKKIHDMSGDSPEKIAKKHLLANYLSRKGKAASVYYKEHSLIAIEFMLHKEPNEIFKMTDSVINTFAADVRTRLNGDVLLLSGYGTNPGVITTLDAKILAYTTVKPLPQDDVVSKNVGGDQTDTAIADIMDILHDLDNLIPDAFIDTNSALVEDYEAKRIEITVGTRHNILNLAMHLNPSHDPAINGTFTIKDAHGVTVKILFMDLHGISETILRMAEYTGTTHFPGYTDKTITFRPNYRSHLDLTFNLDPI